MWSSKSARAQETEDVISKILSIRITQYRRRQRLASKCARRNAHVFRPPAVEPSRGDGRCVGCGGGVENPPPPFPPPNITVAQTKATVVALTTRLWREATKKNTHSGRLTSTSTSFSSNICVYIHVHKTYMRIGGRVRHSVCTKRRYIYIYIYMVGMAHGRYMYMFWSAMQECDELYQLMPYQPDGCPVCACWITKTRRRRPANNYSSKACNIRDCCGQAEHQPKLNGRIIKQIYTYEYIQLGHNKTRSMEKRIYIVAKKWPRAQSDTVRFECYRAY